jgi:FlaA1/EpsC-like NDP-sugar epimerase
MLVYTAEWLSLLVRFDFSYHAIAEEFIAAMKLYTPVNIICCLLGFSVLKLYKSLWEYAGARELLHVVAACILGAGLQLIGMHIMDLHMPRSYYVLFFFVLLIFIAVSRLSYRTLRIVRSDLEALFNKKMIRTMVVGAGDTGYCLIKDMSLSEKITNRVVCIIDDDPHKIGYQLLGIPIVADHSRIREMAKKYKVEEIFITIQSLSGSRKKEIYDICKETKCRLKTLPSAEQIINGEAKVSMLRDVELEDLLGRDPVKINLEEVEGFISGKTVLVTGGGGSIGSELSLQIARCQPKQLILFDIYENTTYALQQELRKKYPELSLVTLIGSVRNSRRVEHIFRDYQPDIVFHAAAHKHVPLMEDSPSEAIKNNVFGTLNVANAAARYHTERMVLISSDKAVNPTNIMGASKRICEMVVQAMARLYPQTNYAAVRFGNVLGSNGSVVPLFKKQIAEGGPVTVTDKNIIRYFMTIPEAVSLVLQAGVYAKGGEIFVLDMGEPVRIDDMARNLIKLSGYEPDEDIKIIYTGLRPGEKLYEECLKAEEGLNKTDNNLIFIGKPLYFDEKKFFRQLFELKKEAYEDTEKMREIISKIVPSYHYRQTEALTTVAAPVTETPIIETAENAAQESDTEDSARKNKDILCEAAS